METGRNPIPAPEASQPSAAGAAPTVGAAAAAFSILVVDDNEANRDALSRRLARKGYAVKTAEGGSEALSHLATEPFDLILLDVMMPGMSGLEVLERIRRTQSPTDLPVIMATAKDQSEDIVKALGLGANDYVTKPLDFAVVLARVQTHLSLKYSVQQIVDLEQRLSQRNAELESANAKLVQAAERARHELEMAAKVQAASLPQSIPQTPGLSFAWAFKPCQELAGDSLNVCPFNAEEVGLYVLDVAGHGVAASLLAVAATRILSSARDSDSILVRNAGEADVGRPVPPAEVAERLNRRFAWNPAIGQFLTFFYVIINAQTRALTYVSAGHPGAVRVGPGTAATILEGSGLPIGVGESYEEQSAQLKPGDRLYLYSDGVTEAMNLQAELFGIDRLTQCLERGVTMGLQDSISLLLQKIEEWHGGLPVRDDISILALECT